MALRMGSDGAPGLELGNGPAVDIDERPDRIPVLLQLDETGSGIADCPDQPQGIARPAAGPVGNGGGGTAQRRQPKHSGSADGQGNRVSPEERKAVALARGFNSAQEGHLPLARAADRKREQRSRGTRTFRREVGKIHRDQLPADACRRVVGEEMDPFRDAVVSDDEAIEHGDVVEQAARSGRSRDSAQSRDDLPFADHPPDGSLSRAGCKTKAVRSSCRSPRRRSRRPAGRSSRSRGRGARRVSDWPDRPTGSACHRAQ